MANFYRRLQQRPLRSGAIGSKTNNLNVDRPINAKGAGAQAASEKETPGALATAGIVERAINRRVAGMSELAKRMAVDPALENVHTYTQFNKFATSRGLQESERKRLWNELVADRLGQGQRFDQTYQKDASKQNTAQSNERLEATAETASKPEGTTTNNTSTAQDSVTVAEKVAPPKEQPSAPVIVAPEASTKEISNNQSVENKAESAQPVLNTPTQAIQQPSDMKTPEEKAVDKESSARENVLTPIVSAPVVVPTEKPVSNSFSSNAASLPSQTISLSTTPPLYNKLSSNKLAEAPLSTNPQPDSLHTSRPLNIPVSPEPKDTNTSVRGGKVAKELTGTALQKELKSQESSIAKKTQAPKIVRTAFTQKVAGSPINVISAGIKQEKNRQQTANTFEEKREAVKNSYLNQVREKPRLAADAAQWQQIAARTPELRGITDAKSFEEKRKELNLQGRNISENAWQYYQASIVLPHMNQTEAQMQQKLEEINKQQADAGKIKVPEAAGHPHIAEKKPEENEKEKKSEEIKKGIDNTAKADAKQEKVSTPFFTTTVLNNVGEGASNLKQEVPQTKPTEINFAPIPIPVSAPVTQDQITIKNRDEIINNQVYAARMQALANGRPWTMSDALTLREQLKKKFAINPTSLTRTTALSLGTKPKTSTFTRAGTQPITRLEELIHGSQAKVTTPRTRQSFTYSKSPIFSRVINQPFTSSSHFNYVSNNTGDAAAPPHSPNSRPNTSHPTRPQQQRRPGQNPVRQIAKAVSFLVRWGWLLGPVVVPAAVILFFVIFFIIILSRSNGTTTTTGTGTNTAEVAIVKSGPAKIDNGGTISYTLTVTAPSAADEIDVTDPILFDISGDPTDVTPADGTYDASSKTLSWKFSNTTANFSQTISFTVKPTITDYWVYNVANATISGAQDSGGGGSTSGTSGEEDNCQGTEAPILPPNDQPFPADSPLSNSKYFNQDSYAKFARVLSGKLHCVDELGSDEDSFVKRVMNANLSSGSDFETNIRTIYERAVAKNINPALIVLTWGGESSFGTNGGEDFNCFDGTSGFSDGLNCELNNFQKYETDFNTNQVDGIATIGVVSNEDGTGPVLGADGNQIQCRYNDPYPYNMDLYTPNCHWFQDVLGPDGNAINGNIFTNYVIIYDEMINASSN